MKTDIPGSNFGRFLRDDDIILQTGMIPQDIEEKKAILTFLKKKSNRPVSLRDISVALGIPRKESRRVKRILNSLVKTGEIYRTRSRLYGAAEKMSLVSGVFEGHRDGYGFVVPERIGERDLFIPPRKTSGAMSGDRVIVRLESPERREGRIIKILERGQKRVVGTLCSGENFSCVKPRGKKTPLDIYIPPGKRGKARVGDTVLVELTSFPSVARPPEGRIIKVFAGTDDPRGEIDMIIENNSLPRKFPSAVLKEARGFSETLRPQGRTDCRHLLTVTIDGETAQDFDDAVSIEKTAEGYTLWVHIADVSHYVPWDSSLDLEARQRGTSVYFPGKVIPMLPHHLSNHLCSLVPKSDRATFTVQIQFDSKGNVVGQDFYPSLINSNERMTYTSVKKILVDNDPAERERYEYLLGSLELMAELCELLRKTRMKRGSLDFDLPEPEILLDIQGRPEAILKAERDLSHMIIEAFMIAANEAVATYLEQNDIPAIYRIHEKPDPEKIEGLRGILRALGVEVKKRGLRGFHQAFRAAKGTAEEQLVNILLLRSLKQAKYWTENIGHFGLASRCYTHFTSPIRRYPDLVVHRILKEALRGRGWSKKRRKQFSALLPEIAFHSSRTERTADEAEREVVDTMRVWFMQERVGKEYEGMIIDITPYGLKVQLKEFFVAAFLHVSYLTDDYYRFDEKQYRLVGRHRGKTYAIGKTIRVRIERVDLWEREIVLSLA